LPTAAASAVRALFPEGEITAVGREREDGVLYYEVVLRDGDAQFEVEVTAKGRVGEVETEVAWDDVPEQMRQRILAETGGARPASVERHQVHGVARGGSFQPVSPPIELYEIEYEVAGVWREVSIAPGGLVMMELDDDDDDDDGSHREGEGRPGDADDDEAHDESSGGA
jgi:hypothetical protein